jgi:CheY-like chemotaxis protein
VGIVPVKEKNTYSSSGQQVTVTQIMPKILLVDDDPDILDIIRLDLEDDPDNKVEVCRSGQEALLLVELHPFDVIISDMRMPKMNGVALIKKLRAMGCNSTVIIYSGLGMGSDIREALESGADHYLRRSGDPETEFSELHRLIRNLP